MKKSIKIIGVIIGLFVLLAGYWTIDNFVYPIKAVHPNYADVEQTFAKLQFPSDWKEINSSENRGLHGRDCNPFNNSGCFHKSKTFETSSNTNIETIKTVVVKEGLCSELTVSEPLYKEDKLPTNNFECSAGSGIKIIGTYRAPNNGVSLAVTTR